MPVTEIRGRTGAPSDGCPAQSRRRVSALTEPCAVMISGGTPSNSDFASARIGHKPRSTTSDDPAIAGSVRPATSSVAVLSAVASPQWRALQVSRTLARG